MLLLKDAGYDWHIIVHAAAKLSTFSSILGVTPPSRHISLPDHKLAMVPVSLKDIRTCIVLVIFCFTKHLKSPPVPRWNCTCTYIRIHSLRQGLPDCNQQSYDLHVMFHDVKLKEAIAISVLSTLQP